jgi:hypothetical protein
MSKVDDINVAQISKGASTESLRGKISHNGKKALKEEYVQALFTAVSGYRISDTITKEFNIGSLEILCSPVNGGRADALLGMTEAC